MLVGYHARAGSGGNPLAHTMSSAKIERIFLNDRQASELLLHGTIASKYHVPLAFVSGDSVICGEIKSISPNNFKNLLINIYYLFLPHLHYEPYFHKIQLL